MNVVRNELCINDIGFHKTAACRERLLSINPSANIECITLALGSQVSAQAMDHAVNELSNCDLIIDASASTNSFNMVSSISTKHMKPLVWLEVFAGGIGGLIARSRPKLDPPALHGRNQINNWCDRQGIDWINSSKNDYELSGNKELPFVADDAEVSIIASHAARYAIDILSSNDDSIFPHSAYLIGLKNEWAFSQPFVTHPIELVNEGEWGMKSEDLTVVQKQEILALLQSQ